VGNEKTISHYCGNGNSRIAVRRPGNGSTPHYGSSPASGSTITVGTASIGSPVTTTLQINETGGWVTLDVTSHTLIGTNAADFSVTPATLTISGGGTDTLTVQCTPGAAGLRTATLTVYHNAPESAGTYTLNCTGTATPGYGSMPPAASTINIGTANVGSSVSAPLQIIETGTATLNITSHALTGTNAGDFSVTPATLSIADTGAPQNLTIQCTPTATGLRTATLTVNHNVPGSSAYTLNCTGTTPPVTASVTLTGISSITGSTVLATGNATGTGIGERGFYWWIPPTTATHFGGSESGLIPEGYGAGSFSLNLTGLKPGNTYHAKAYVKVGGQIITSDEQLFTTATTGATGKTAPTVLTDTVNFTVSGSSITVSGEITDIGSSAVNVYGFVYAPHTAPFTGDDMPKTGDRAYAMWDQTPLYQGLKFTGTVKNIPPGKWYLRAYAHNENPDSDAAQTASLNYGEDISFTIACTPETCIPGDVNGDGKVDLADAMLVLRILAGIPVGNVNLNADVNGDGKIGLEELGYILQKTAGLR